MLIVEGLRKLYMYVIVRTVGTYVLPDDTSLTVAQLTDQVHPIFVEGSGRVRTRHGSRINHLEDHERLSSAHFCNKAAERSSQICEDGNIDGHIDGRSSPDWGFKPTRMHELSSARMNQLRRSSEQDGGHLAPRNS